MSELTRTPEIEPTVELIANGLNHWLMKEVGSSTSGRNHYLDEFNKFREQLKLPYHASDNDNASKNRSHYNRLLMWTNAFAEDKYDEGQRDYSTALQIFCGQMYLSGLFRVQCFMEAADQDDYYRRRLDRNFIGIDFEAVVSNRLSELYGGVIPGPGKLDWPQIFLRGLARRTLALNEKQRAYVQELHKTGVNDVGQEISPTIDTILGLQQEWTRLIVDHITFAAAERGGQLAVVPFLEPKSISDDPQVYYPFAEAI